jgi:cytochrome c oxidase assembly protein Cox11
MDGFDSYVITRNNDGAIKILINYNNDIQDKNITVSFDPSLSGQLAFSRIKPISKAFQIIPTDNEAAVFYDQNVYDRA